MGSFGSVYRGYLLDPNIEERNVAVKIVAYTPGELHQLGRELYFLKTLNSPFIVHYVDSVLTGSELYIIMELCDAGSLLDLKQSTSKNLNEAEMKAVVACRFHPSSLMFCYT